jgi:hypothetical protein
VLFPTPTLPAMATKCFFIGLPLSPTLITFTVYRLPYSFC